MRERESVVGVGLLAVLAPVPAEEGALERQRHHGDRRVVSRVSVDNCVLDQ